MQIFPMNARFVDSPCSKFSPVDSDALNALQLRRYCCRRMVLTHVDIVERLIKYTSVEVRPMTGEGGAGGAGRA